MESYFVFTINNRQYLGSEGEVVKLDRITGNIGEKKLSQSVELIAFDGKVELGNPSIANRLINFEIIEQGKEKKQYGFKYKPKGNYRRRWGYRRDYTKVKVLGVN